MSIDRGRFLPEFFPQGADIYTLTLTLWLWKSGVYFFLSSVLRYCFFLLLVVFFWWWCLFFFSSPRVTIMLILLNKYIYLPIRLHAEMQNRCICNAVLMHAGRLQLFISHRAWLVLSRAFNRSEPGSHLPICYFPWWNGLIAIALPFSSLRKRFTHAAHWCQIHSVVW